jgi:hypothetical protein
VHIGRFRVTLNRLHAFHVGLPVPGISQEIFAAQFKKRFQGNGMTYEHRLIDDMVAATPKWEDGFIWTRRNNDGEVQPDAVAPRFGSPEPVELAKGLAVLIGPGWPSLPGSRFFASSARPCQDRSFRTRGR